MILASSLISKTVNSAIDNTLNFKLTIPERDNIQGKNIFGFNFLWGMGLTFIENGMYLFSSTPSSPIQAFSNSNSMLRSPD